MAKKKKKNKKPEGSRLNFFSLIQWFRRVILKQKPKEKPYWLMAVIGFCVLMILYVIYFSIYTDKSYPNIFVAGQQVSGNSYKEVAQNLRHRSQGFENKKVEIHYKDKKWELAPEDISLTYDNKKTADAVWKVGREKTFFGRFWSRIAVLGKRTEVNPIYSYDKEKFNGFISKIAEDVDIPEIDATGVIKKGTVSFVQERSGSRVQQEKFKKQLARRFDNFSVSKIDLPVATSHPKVTLGDTEKARQQVETMLKSKLTLKWQKGTWTVGQDIFSGWIKFKSEKIKGSNNYQLVAYLDDEEIGSYLKKISKEIDGSPKNAKLTITNGVVVLAEEGQIGYAFDQAASSPAIKTAIEQGAVQEITLAVKEVQPEVTSANYMNLGIKEIIGSGATNFKGSTDARKHNVANGTRIVSGTLIKPGEEFSAVKTIGNVDASTGFVLGLVIKGSKTEPEYGGGLCQVSSTLFRSALYSGLKITERKNHAYRVGYYETDGNGKYIGPGLDSTIYGPHPDLRFINDTDNWILIQGHIEGTRLTFDFWGTKDGRIANVSVPAISNEVPAPAAEYIQTDTLFVGQQEQIEGSHPGATVVVNYSVMKNGQEINKQTFNSKFKPWGAKFLVGTKPVEPAPAPPPPAPTP